MADDSLAQWTLDKRAKAHAYDVLTKRLNALVSDLGERTAYVSRYKVKTALQQAEDAYRADLARGQKTLESLKTPRAD